MTRPGMGNALYECSVCLEEKEEKDMASGNPPERTGICDECALSAVQEKIQQRIAEVVKFDPSDPIQDSLSELFSDIQSGAVLRADQQELLDNIIK